MILDLPSTSTTEDSHSTIADRYQNLQSNEFFNSLAYPSTTAATTTTLLSRQFFDPQYQVAGLSPCPFDSSTSSSSLRQWGYSCPNTEQQLASTSEPEANFTYDPLSSYAVTSGVYPGTGPTSGLLLATSSQQSSSNPSPSTSPSLLYPPLCLDSLSKEFKNLLKNIPRKSKEATVSASDQAAFRTCHPQYSRE